jgi:hypothetical protein
LPSLSQIFGAELQPRSGGCTVDENQGQVSLGCLRPAAPPKIFINNFGGLRARVTDGTFDINLSATDLRLYEEDQQTPRPEIVTALQRRIDAGIAVILSVGLARAYQARNDTARRHWLQVNNLHLEDDPIWRVN